MLYAAFFWFGVVSFIGLLALVGLVRWRLATVARQERDDRFCASCQTWTKGHAAVCGTCARSYATGRLHDLSDPRQVVHLLHGPVDGAAIDLDPDGTTIRTLTIRTAAGIDVRVGVQSIELRAR